MRAAGQPAAGESQIASQNRTAPYDFDRPGPLRTEAGRTAQVLQVGSLNIPRTLVSFRYPLETDAKVLRFHEAGIADDTGRYSRLFLL